LRRVICLGAVTVMVLMGVFRNALAQQDLIPAESFPSASSSYVSLDSWIYEAFDRLHGLGYADTAYLGLRPWTRLSCLHIVQQTAHKIAVAPDDSEAKRIYAALAQELSREGESHGELEELYSRSGFIAGQPLANSAHFGQTIINDYGRPYGEGFNAIDGFIAHAEGGRFSLAVRGEYQHAPAPPVLPQAALDAISLVDEIPVQVPSMSQTNVFRLLDANASFHLQGHEISIGKSEDWWGPGKGGAMAWSNNAEPIYAFRVNRVEPLYVPLLSRITGPFRYEALFGDLKGWTTPREPWVQAQKFSFKPTKDLEFGFSRVVIFAGEGHVPLTFGSFWRSFTSFSNVPTSVKMSRSDPGERHSSFDFSWRLPGVAKWVTLYSDSIVHDDTSPIDAPRRAAINPGIYLSHLPDLPHLDLRVEGVNTDTPAGTIDGGHFIYWEGQYRNGYTNKGNLLGSWIGREGKGGQAWLTYWLSPKESIQVGYRNAKVAAGFLPGGTTQNDFSLRAVVKIKTDLELTSFAQYEAWKAPLLAPGRMSDFTGSVQLTYFPKLQWKK
jgi:Capsule assembly protein Wzi